MNPEAVTRFVERLGPAFIADDPAVTEKVRETAHVATIRAMYQAIIDGDYEKLASVMADDIELEMEGPPEMPLAGKWKGREAALAAAARNYSLLEDQHPTIEAVLAQGDLVAILARERGRFKTTGREYDSPFLHLFTFRDGKIARMYGFADNAAMLAACRPW
jgi:ketosteroid isomerase-like protein